MQITSFLVSVALTCVSVEYAAAETQLRSSKLHARGHIETSDAEDAAVPLIPQISVLETPSLTAAVMDPEGGINPFGKGKLWPDHSEVPKWAQFLLGFSWVAMLAVIPFIIPLVSRRAVTNTQGIVGALMLVVVLGGFYLFTNIILFQSAHFKEIRPLTVVECIYFMSQVITTVGYGDITPAKIRGQVFVGMYVLGALFIISMLISDIAKHMVAAAGEYREKRIVHSGETPRADIHKLITPEKPSPASLFQALAIFAAIDIVWILFFSFYPGEEKTVFQCVYMSVITLSSVGFGWFTPLTEAGMIFASFFFLFGTGALGNVICNFTDLMVKLNEWEQFKPESKAAAVGMLRDLAENKDEVTDSEFLQFGLLQMKLVSKDEIEAIKEAFACLKPKNGTVTLKAVEDHLSVDEEESKAPKA